jgi:PRTRC genetic system ThiF family protein
MAFHTYRLNTSRRLSILVVGAGGSGSAIFLALPYLNQAMQAWGHPGLDVTLIDADTVSATNCVRQPFARTDIGQNKATVLVNRVNLFWGTDWKAAPYRFTKDAELGQLDIVIGCVDSKASRKEIHQAVTVKAGIHVRYWLDLGNNANHGQFILGQPYNTNGFQNQREKAKREDRLRTAAELYPEIIDTTTPEDNLPSCSAVEALERQEPFINQTLAMQALAMLTQLIRYGKTSYHGAFFNAKTGTTQPIPVPETKLHAVRRSQ